ncbi:MAG: phytanoyl-CoA dioxygenase family protein, partial [Rhodobacteraceae bacterium]|nr:phytanoyl-CoA dioxygenase family protein [Paracoccaceae bacterium]
GRMFHASGPNHSDDRRIAIVIRYVTPELVRDAPGLDYAMLVRGTDSCKNWINVAPPSTLFGQGEIELYDQILKYKEAVLSAGAEKESGLFNA